MLIFQKSFRPPFTKGGGERGSAPVTAFLFSRNLLRCFPLRLLSPKKKRTNNYMSPHLADCCTAVGDFFCFGALQGLCPWPAKKTFVKVFLELSKLFYGVAMKVALNVQFTLPPRTLKAFALPHNKSRTQSSKLVAYGFYYALAPSVRRQRWSERTKEQLTE